ncbi:MAG: WbqC family protein [Armatimonadetes bacterium]|nr:WbqC family protein [Armatimonadota bacterium]
MKLVVLQPSYLPWLGYLDQYHWADAFVLYDDVQYDKNGWRNRNRILTAQGVQWLTVPVRLKGQDFPPIRQVPINNQDRWPKKHVETLRQAYSRSRYFEMVFPPIERVLARPWELLVDLDVAMLKALVELLGMPWKGVLASELEVPGRQTDRLVGICRQLGATEYLTGDAARDYLDEQAFSEAGVRVHWHGYEHPCYRQRNEEFVPYLSVVDLLFHHGPESLEILARSRAPACG